MADIKRSSIKCRLMAFFMLSIFFWFTNIGLVKCVSVEKDLSMTLKEKHTLDKFRAQVSPLLYEDFMKNDIYLIRWLRARNFNVNEAERMLKENIRWRQENKIDSIQSEDFKDIWQDYPSSVDTYDREGRPIITIEMNLWDIRAAVISGRGPRALRYLDQVMDNAMRQIFERQQKGMNVTQWKCLLNAEGLSMVRHGCPACISLWVQFLYSLENHFPGFVDELIVIEANFAVNTLISTLRPFLSDQLRDTFRIFSNKQQWMAYLDQRVSKDQRRPAYGGTKPPLEFN